MKNLGEIGLVELSQKDCKQTNGGVIMLPWATIFKWVRRAIDIGQVIDACSDVANGYKACRN